MLKTQKEKELCKKYSTPDDSGRLHCYECPMRKGDMSYDFRCKANSHYNSMLKDWEYDEDTED